MEAGVVVGVFVLLLVTWWSVGAVARAEAETNVVGRPPPRRYGITLTLVEWLVVIVVAGVVVGLVMPATQTGHGPNRRTQRRNHLKQIGFALEAYHGRYKCLPPAFLTDAQGRPTHSWQVLLLPYTEEKALYGRINFAQPWDAPANRFLANEMPSIFAEPGDIQGRKAGLTPFQAVVGSQTVWPGPHAGTFADAKDGLEHTLTVVESPTPVRWMEPRDVSSAEWTGVGGGSTLLSWFPDPERRCAVLQADGSVTFIRADTSRDRLRRMATADNGQLHPALGGKPLPGEVIDPAADVKAKPETVGQ